MLQSSNDSATERPVRKTWTLVLLALAQFMVVLDVTIVNVALPDIQRGLGFSVADLQWVISGYTLAFGGFLLLGGRAADLLGRRRLFLVGLAIFTGASLFAGLAPSPELLIAARAVQGFGGALLSPTALSILTVTFPAGRERNVALGVFGALAGIGGTFGVVLGGVLVSAIGWEWVFFVNVPIGAVLLAAVPALVRESRAPRQAGGVDAAGAVLGTAGLLALVFGVIRAEPLGWGATEVVASLAAGVALLLAFVTVERRSAAPLVPLRLFRSRALSTSSGVLAINGATFLGMFFALAIFLQQVRGLSALQTGFQLLPMGVAAIAGAMLASNLVTRLGTRPVQLTGAVLNVAGLLLLSRAGATGAYAAEVLPGIVLFGLGVLAVGVPSQIAAVAEVRHEDAGAASGIVTVFYQVGGALGLAVITTLANAHATAVAAAGASAQQALVEGFQRGLTVTAVVSLVGAAVVLGLAPRLRPDADTIAEAQLAA